MRKIEGDLHPVSKFSDLSCPRTHAHFNRGFPPSFARRIPDPLEGYIFDFHLGHGRHRGAILTLSSDYKKQEQAKYGTLTNHDG